MPKKRTKKQTYNAVFDAEASNFHYQWSEIITWINHPNLLDMHYLEMHQQIRRDNSRLYYCCHQLQLQVQHPSFSFSFLFFFELASSFRSSSAPAISALAISRPAQNGGKMAHVGPKEQPIFPWAQRRARLRSVGPGEGHDVVHRFVFSREQCSRSFH